MNDSIIYTLQKWIIYHPNLIQSPMENYYIQVKLYDINVGARTEPEHLLC